MRCALCGRSVGKGEARRAVILRNRDGETVELLGDDGLDAGGVFTGIRHARCHRLAGGVVPSPTRRKSGG